MKRRKADEMTQMKVPPQMMMGRLVILSVMARMSAKRPGMSVKSASQEMDIR